jgi:hypothetical protein
MAVPAAANPEPAKSTAAETTGGGEADKSAGGGEVVRLDRFRKK